MQPVWHLLLLQASGQAPHGFAGNVPCESERSLAPPHLRAAEVSLETLPCIDSLSQCSPVVWPLDPARRARSADSHTVARLAQESLRDKGSDEAKSSRIWLCTWLSTSTQVGYKVVFSKGATGPANTVTPHPGQDGRSLLPPTSLLAGQTPGSSIACPGWRPDPSRTAPTTRWPGKSPWEAGAGAGVSSVALAGALPGLLRAARFIEHVISIQPPTPQNIKGVKQKLCGR